MTDFSAHASLFSFVENNNQEQSESKATVTTNMWRKQRRVESRLGPRILGPRTIELKGELRSEVDDLIRVIFFRVCERILDPGPCIPTLGEDMGVREARYGIVQRYIFARGPTVQFQNYQRFSGPAFSAELCCIISTVPGHQGTWRNIYHHGYL